MTHFQDIAEKVKAGVRLSEADGLFLFEHADLLELGQLAHSYNRTRNEGSVYYNINRHINPTNVCAKDCKFCAFSKKPLDVGAYEYSIEQILEKAGEALDQGATEVHMVGGLHPRWSWQKFLEIIGSVHHKFPELHIKAFTAVEIDWLAARARKSIREVLEELKSVGLGSMPGGGAEIFHPFIRTQICDTKTDADRWIEIHRTAHEIGLRSNCTMLYGHIENYEHRIDHLRRLRDLQDETGGFNVFIPLAFQPYDNDMGINQFTKGEDDLRTIAVSRLFLDNFANIKAYWIMLGQDIAQLALNFGANDLDGTVTEEKISAMAGGRAGMALSISDIKSMIAKTGSVPVERDTLYRSLKSANPEDLIVSSEEDQERAGLLMYKMEQGELLERDDWLHTVRHGDLFHLAHSAEQRNQHEQVSECPAIEIDLAGDNSQPHLERLLTAAPSAIAGIKQLISIGVVDFEPNSLASKPWEYALSELSANGLQLFSSSPRETETDLTNSELLEFHRYCHRLDVQTIAKVELRAPVANPSFPFWESFVDRLLAYRSLQDETRGFRGVIVEPAPDSLVTPIEYLRGLAMARSIMNSNVRIIAPFEKIPTFRSRKDFSTKDDPAKKYSDLLTRFGATSQSHMRSKTAKTTPQKYAAPRTTAPIRI